MVIGQLFVLSLDGLDGYRLVHGDVIRIFDPAVALRVVHVGTRKLHSEKGIGVRHASNQTRFN